MNNLINQNNSEKEKILKEVNENIEKMEPLIKVSEVNGKITFIPAIREKFKGKTLFSFLERIYGKEYKNERWELLEEYENQNYIEIIKFFDLLDQKLEQKKEEYILDKVKEDIIDKKILTASADDGNRIKSDKEKIDESFIENINLFTEKISDEQLTEKTNRENIREYLIKDIMDLEKEKNIQEETKVENKILNIEKKEETDEKVKAEKKPEYKSFRSDKSKHKEKDKSEEEIIISLISKTITLLEEKKFEKAVENIKTLAQKNKYYILNNKRVRLSLEGVLLRVIRFFVPRNSGNREYWKYFSGKYDEKIEFYNNVVRLREFCGLKLRFDNEGYEVYRRD